MLKKTLLSTAAVLSLAAASSAPAPSLHLGRLAKVGTVDERYQGFNVEMVEVTGGRFWAPYGGPAGEIYRQRAPLDLTDPRLLAMAKQLAPSVMRVSGTWSNNTYLEAEGEHLAAPPEGYKQVLTRQQWRNVVAFSRAADASIVTSFAVSGGTRGADGVWKTDQAQRVAELTREAGGKLYAAEFFNEPNMPGAALGMPKGYNAENYGAEFRIFRDWARKAVPDMKIIGPGGVGEGALIKKANQKNDVAPNFMSAGFISSEDMLKANPGTVDAVSYHYYGSVSQRCASFGIGTADKSQALSAEWLDRTLRDSDHYGRLRDKYEPGKPLWNTETAQAACGGSPWASTFLDSFRYLNQLGLLAQQGVREVIHNTLATSDYALVDRDTMTPRPNFWAAVLWRRTMGTTVLAAPKSPSPKLRLYAHCLRGSPGGVALLAINTDAAPQRLSLGARANTWTMTGKSLETRSISVNGKAPAMTAAGGVAGLEAVAVSGRFIVPGQSIAFAAVPGAGNPACR